jgi:hypothetical protein
MLDPVLVHVPREQLQTSSVLSAMSVSPLLQLPKGLAALIWTFVPFVPLPHEMIEDPVLQVAGDVDPTCDSFPFSRHAK